MNIIFFGTPDFAASILKKFLEVGLAPVAVVTAPDRPKGRGQKLTKPPVKELAEKHNIPVLQPEKIDRNFELQVTRYEPLVFAIAAYGKILPKSLLDIPQNGAINVHPSLLPRHRGPSPIQGAILAGDKITGVTLMLTDEKMDHGPIIAQSTYHIPQNIKQGTRITYQELHDKLAALGGEMLIKILPKWVAGEIKSEEQDHSKATYTKLLTKEDGHIDWTKSAEEIDRMVRALNPWPGAWSYVRSPTSDMKRVKILKGFSLQELPGKEIPEKLGMLFKTKNGRFAATTGNGIYIIENIQLEGKQPSTTVDVSLDNSQSQLE